MTDGPMGMAEDDAVCFRKYFQQGVFWCESKAVTMDEADSVAVEIEQLAVWVMVANRDIAHVATDCINRFVGKDVQHGLISDVTGMDNDVTGGKALFDLFFEWTVRSMTMGVRKDSSLYHHVV